MPWIQKPDLTVDAGNAAALFSVTAANPAVIVTFPDFPQTRVRLWGVIYVTIPGGTAPLTGLTIQTQDYQVWHNSQYEALVNAGIGSVVAFYVPKNFGSSLKVRSFYLTP